MKIMAFGASIVTSPFNQLKHLCTGRSSTDLLVEQFFGEKLLFDLTLQVTGKWCEFWVGSGFVEIGISDH